MIRLITRITAVSATAALAAAVGTGIAAAADDYAGQTYGDVQAALSKAKLKGVIASRVGDAVSDDKCVVTRSEKAPWIKINGKKFKEVSDTVLLFLNCNAAVASPATPGNSAASPEGRAAIAAAHKNQSAH